MKNGNGLNAKLRIMFMILIAIICVFDAIFQNIKYKTAKQSLFSHMFGLLAGVLVGCAALKETGEKKIKPIFWCIGASIYTILITLFVEINLIRSYLYD